MVAYVITIIAVAVGCYRWRKRRGAEQQQQQQEEEEEEGGHGEYNMVLAHDVNTTTHQSTGTVPNPAYSKMQILGSGNDPSEYANLSQLPVETKQNTTRHTDAAYMALSADTLQNQTYARLNIGEKGETAEVEEVSGERANHKLAGVEDTGCTSLCTAKCEQHGTCKDGGDKLNS